jgi:hypothetical protein
VLAAAVLRLGACHGDRASGVSHKVKLPRRRSPASYSRQFATLNFIVSI